MQESISAKCVVVDEQHRKESWPQEFVVLPRLGDYVRSKGGVELPVTRIIHSIPAGLRVRFPEVTLELGINI